MPPRSKRHAGDGSQEVHWELHGSMRSSAISDWCQSQAHGTRNPRRRQSPENVPSSVWALWGRAREQLTHQSQDWRYAPALCPQNATFHLQLTSEHPGRPRRLYISRAYTLAHSVSLLAPRSMPLKNGGDLSAQLGQIHWATDLVSVVTVFSSSNEVTTNLRALPGGSFPPLSCYGSILNAFSIKAGVWSSPVTKQLRFYQATTVEVEAWLV